MFYMVRNQLAMYTEALNDVKFYVIVVLASDTYTEPAPTGSKYVIYRQLFEEFNVIL